MYQLSAHLPLDHHSLPPAGVVLPTVYRNVDRYVEELRAAFPRDFNNKREGEPVVIRLGEDRWLDYTRRYSFAVLERQHLCRVVESGPIIEIGGGSGWNKFQLEQFAKVSGNPFRMVSYDIHPRPQWGTAVEKGGPEVIADFPGYTLFMSWPPGAYDRGSEMAEEALRRYLSAGGRTLLYIGEFPVSRWDDDFATGTEGFWKLMERFFPMPPEVVPLRIHFDVARNSCELAFLERPYSDNLYIFRSGN